MNRHLTAVCGVVIETPFEVPGGWPVPSDADVQVDLKVTLGAPAADTAGALHKPTLERVLLPDGQRLYSSAVIDGATVFRVHGIGDIVFGADLAEGVVHLEASTDPGLLVVMMAGMVPAFWLMERGEVVLHASAVCVDGATVAFVGDSGMGKSTLAALCCAAGAHVVADDLLRVASVAGQLCWIGGTSELRLRPGAWSLVEESLRSVAVRSTADGRQAVAPPMATVGSGRVDVIVVPRLDRSATEVSVAGVGGSEAMLLLSRFPRLQGWQDPMRVRAQFEAMAAIARTVPIRIATVPWGPPFDPAIARQLLDQVLSTDGR